MPLDTITALVILLGLQAKHFLFDFVFQSDWQLRGKGHYGHPGGLVHAALHALGTACVCLVTALLGLLSWPLVVGLAIADFLIHYHVDWAKAQISKKLDLTPNKHAYWTALGADQAAHQATYIGLVALVAF